MKNANVFWDKKHEEQDSYWLTGSKVPKMLEWHDIEIPSGKVVMEIGVGKGTFFRALAKNNTAYAVDVSQVALDNVRDVTQHRHLEVDSVPSEVVDLAICHLVLCHCNDEQMRRLIEQTLRVLKPGGVASFHTASSTGQTGFIKNQVDSGLVFFRSHDVVRDTIEAAGGKIVNTKVKDTSSWTPRGTQIETCILRFTKDS